MLKTPDLPPLSIPDMPEAPLLSGPVTPEPTPVFGPAIAVPVLDCVLLLKGTGTDVLMPETVAEAALWFPPDVMMGVGYVKDPPPLIEKPGMHMHCPLGVAVLVWI